MLDRLADERVALVGTGATAIQVVPYLGRHAKQLYVVQRTPSAVDARSNAPTDPEWVKTLEPGWQKKRQQNFNRGMNEAFRPGEPDMICDFWTELSRNIQTRLAAMGWPSCHRSNTSSCENRKATKSWSGCADASTASSRPRRRPKRRSPTTASCASGRCRTTTTTTPSTSPT